MSNAVVLVPLDGSKFAESAVPIALSTARSIGARVEFISVVYDLELLAAGEPALSAFPPSAIEEQKWKLEEYLEGLAAKITKSSQVPVSNKVVRGLVPQTIEDYVDETEPALIVMSTHGRGVLSRAWLGSVADHVARHVNVPSLLIRPEEGVESEITDEDEFERIVVSLDGSDLAERSLPWATKFALSAGAELHLLRVVPPVPPFQSVYIPDAALETKEYLDQGEDEARRYLSEISDRMSGEGLNLKTEVMTGIPPAPGIIKYCDRHNCDLIAITTHGRSGLARVALGSVADKVIRSACSPVLLTRGMD